MTRIAICAPACPITPEDAALVKAIAGDYGVSVHVHPQCFASAGHFAGDDATRLAAFLDCANDPGFDAVWFARGGYGSNRIAQSAVAQLSAPAAHKRYMGYSDMGYLLGALYRARVGVACHGPMVADGRRMGGEAALRRALSFFAGEKQGLEPSLAGEKHPVVAFNLTTLAMLAGTPIMPGLAGHVVMIEEVSEYLYAIDRLMFHVTAHLGGVAGVRLGRVSDVPDNDRPFGAEAQDIVADWCARHAIPFLGAADIGHDVDNCIVPFGLASGAHPQ
ncbi:muramoyltetrapeptide carboxypeptidase [Novosphingobium sp. SG751A]|uniref:LD-carboxypeptidase n=1 Tax=Novosphingobium sp. SG751A TaxID=2587000 RepID=UPI001555BA70|nr:LD-carboxypeptidase [Novosphingobium sp. SG751A]NOW46646.1 muramoyltetrapeptide carboxypeptidase [Novosphingobium sp. SG751A]